MPKKELKGLRRARLALLGAYGIALLVCFICDLAINRSLTWFPVVLFSILTAFSVTNLPWLLRSERLVVPALSVTVCIYALLYFCERLTGGAWRMRYALPIAAFPAALCWIGVGALRTRARRGMKAAVALVLLGVLVACMNPWVEFVLMGDPIDLRLFWNFEFDVIEQAGHYSMNFLAGLALTLAGAATALFAALRKR